MSKPARSSRRGLAALGEQLVGTTSLTAQRDRIAAVAGRLVPGRVDVWLDESLFRLPDWEEAPLFSAQPPLEGMRQALKNGRICDTIQSSAQTDEPWVALPLQDQGIILGVLQLTRPRGATFRGEEVDLLEDLAGVAAVGLLASHRVAVERFRQNQLNLVSQVSAQIANVMDVDELARRVADLIQKTFHYSYVAIFTLEPGATTLRFRASASAAHRGRRRTQIPLEVELGQGLIGHAAQSGERIVCDDVRAEPRFRYVDSLPQTRAEVVLPLKVKGRVLGVLDVQSDRLNAFHPNDLLVLGALSDNIARAVEGARLYSDLRHRARQLALVAEVSRSVTSTLELSLLLRDAATLIHERFGYPYVHFFSVHPNRRRILYEAGSGRRSKALASYSISLDDPQGLIPWVARSGQSALVNDVSQDARYRPSPLPPKNTRSELTVPLIYDRNVVGLLDIQSDRLNAFSEDDRLTFEAVADIIAAAIHNADLYRSEQWRRLAADSLREVAVLLSANVGVDQVLEAILMELGRTLPIDVVAIWLLREGDLYPAAVHGCTAEALEAARRASPEASTMLTTALLSEAPLIRKPADPPGPSGLAAGFERDYSSIAAPLRVGEQPVGVLTLAHRNPGRYGHEAQAMTTTFASYAAVAIENARLYDAAQEQAYASAALLQVAQAVVSLSDLDEILASIVRIMPILVGVDCAALYLWDVERGVFYPAHEYGLPQEARASLWERDFPASAFPLLDAACETGGMLLRPLAAEDGPANWPDLQPPWVERDSPGARSDAPLLAAIPLMIKSDLYGVLLVSESAGGQRFRDRRLEIITGIAQQAALAIQNDRLQREMVARERLETEVQLARQIQQAFIPESLPEPPGWELAARWRTARQVGGDFYDVIELPGRRLGLFIADVADKGVPAAMYMALTRTLVRAAVLERGSPAEALRRVNELLLPDTRQGMFVTAFYAVVSLESGEMAYVNAGHNPPFWLRSDGSLERLTRTGLPLGVMEEAGLAQHAIHLGAGDSLLLYTDGLSEAFSSEGEMFGEKRIEIALSAQRSASAQVLLDEIERILLLFLADQPLSDDLTMLVIRRQHLLQ